jgi:uncharacterized protein YutE (UPF0331/DUF86 family)
LVDRDTFERRLGKLEELLRDLRALAETEAESFLADRGLQAQAERWLQLAAQCTVDLAYQLIADRGWSVPATNREAFSVLRREGVLSEELAARMGEWAGLRNLLVHLYLTVDSQRLYEILTTELDQLEDFARAVTRALDG